MCYVYKHLLLLQFSIGLEQFIQNTIHYKELQTNKNNMELNFLIVVTTCLRFLTCNETIWNVLLYWPDIVHYYWRFINSAAMTYRIVKYITRNSSHKSFCSQTSVFYPNNTFFIQNSTKKYEQNIIDTFVKHVNLPTQS